MTASWLKPGGEQVVLVLSLDQIGPGDQLLVGGKAFNLGRLLALGVPVPPGFAVTITAWEHFLQFNGCSVPVASAYPLGPKHAAGLRQVLSEAPFPPDLLDDLYQAYVRLRKAGYPALICRSSARSEDGASHSFAGQFESVANIRSFSKLLASIRRCWLSALAEGVTAYTRHHGEAHPAMGLVVQAMVESAVSGVAFSVDPVTGQASPVIEATWGLGEVLVQGYVTPDRYVFGGERPALARIGTKDCFLRTAPRVQGVYPGDRTVLIDPWTGERIPVSIIAVDRVDHLYYARTPVSHRERPSLLEPVVERIGDLIRALSDRWGSPQEMEFAVGPDGRLAVVQLRPATAVAQLPPAENDVGADRVDTVRDHSGFRVFSGEEVTVVSPGHAAGPAAVIEHPGQLDQVREGDILVTATTTPAYVPAMVRAAGILSADGGILSHTAIVSRELHKPCLGVTHEALSQVRTGDWVSLDSRARQVVVHGHSPPHPGTPGSGPHAYDGTGSAQRPEPDLAGVAAQVGVAPAQCHLARYVYPLSGSSATGKNGTAAVLALETLTLALATAAEEPEQRLSPLRLLARTMAENPGTEPWFLEVPSWWQQAAGRVARTPWRGILRPDEVLRQLGVELAHAGPPAPLNLICTAGLFPPKWDPGLPRWVLAGEYDPSEPPSRLSQADLVLVFTGEFGWRARLLRRAPAIVARRTRRVGGSNDAHHRG